METSPSDLVVNFKEGCNHLEISIETRDPGLDPDLLNRSE
jgi:hypothetical protein